MGKTTYVMVYFIIFFLSLSAQADLRLFEWTADTTLAPLILPVKANEKPEQAAERYLKNLERNPDLMELFAGRKPYLPNSVFKEVTDKDLDSKALLIANLPKDYTLDSLRVSNFMKLFALQGYSSYILPVAANLGLSVSESQELFRLVSEKFPMLVAMGGEDVDPAQYKKPNLHSRNVIPARDQFEIQLIKSYVKSDKGFLFGVCRGAQISSVALGYGLNQHVPFHIGKDVSHANDWHDVSLLKTKNNILYSLANSKGQLYINSLHHQSVIFQEGGPLEVAARSSDGVVEALEFKNGKGLLLQFHPELMENALGEKIISRVFEQKTRTQGGSCRHLFH